MESAIYSIQNIVSYNFDDWFGIIEPLLEKLLLYHSNLDTPFFDEFAPKAGETYDTAHIIDVFVEEEYRGQGIASELMEKAVSWAECHSEVRSTILEVWRGNEGVFDFYKHFGFDIRCYTLMRANDQENS